MRVLWLVSITLPPAAKAFGLSAGMGGGWLQGQLNYARERCSLAVCAVNPSVRQICQATVDGVEYILLPTGSDLEFRTVLSNWQPLLVHIWGTEYEAARVLFAECNPDRTLISLQGLMSECSRHLMDGVPERLLHSSGAQNLVDSFVPGGLLDRQQAEFARLAKSETELLQHIRHVTGRTRWDRECLARLAPQATYYPCHETLRPVFYSGQWQPHEGAPTLFLTQGNYPLKGLHRLLKALPAVKAKHPDFVLKIAGWPPLNKGPLLRPVIRWMFPYQTYCHDLMVELGLDGHIQHTGPLNAEQIKAQFLACSVSLLCSSIENSPNALGEAMLLGVPCVSSAVGGVPSMVTDGVDGLLYPAEDTDALAKCILAVLDDPKLAARLGAQARARALTEHDPETNGEHLFEIYNEMLEGSGAS